MKRNVARILGAHGVKGEVKLFVNLEEVEALKVLSPLFDIKNKPYTLQSLKHIGKSVVVKFEEIQDRNLAETLNGIDLFADSALFPKPDDGEFYQEDLIGFKAIAEGKIIGEVIAFHNFGASDIIEIKCDNGEELMLSFTDDFIGEIDQEKQEIEIFLPDYV